MREGRYLLAHTYALEGERESNRFLAYSKWDELRPLQLGMKDDAVNLIGFQRKLWDMQLIVLVRIEGFRR